jgi:hypothetical protein
MGIIDAIKGLLGESVRFVGQVAESAPTPCSAVELDARIANED